ncbi:hypothetical protein ACLKA6_015172 [Drosophila palustris]
MTNRESREILLDASIESAVIPEVVIDVYQLEQQQQQVEVSEEKPEQRGIFSYVNCLKPPQNWTNLGITLCVFYNLFIALILLGTYIHFKLAYSLI